MKQKIYILGLAAALIINIGLVFKINHWPAAGILLTLGILMLVFVFIPVALKNHYRVEGSNQNLILYIVTWLSCFIIFMGMLFKIMHWPHAGLALLIALPFPYVVFLPVFLVVTSKNKNFNIYNTIFVLFLLAIISVFSALLALNVSKGTIDDSYNISRNYCNVEKAMANLPVVSGESEVNLKIDEIIRITNDYQDRILRHEGLTREQWEKDPGNLLRPDSPDIAAAVLSDSGESYPGDRLQNALRELIALMEQSKGSEATAKALPAILGLADEIGKEPDRTIRYVSENNLSWVLIYLDGLETNLLMIK
jgi:hypothetical protein